MPEYQVLPVWEKGIITRWICVEIINNKVTLVARIDNPNVPIQEMFFEEKP